MTDVPSSSSSSSSLGASLAAAFRQLTASEAMTILDAIPESQLPLDDEALLSMWLPALENAACRDFETPASSLWNKADRLGVLDRAWLIDRRPSLLTTLVQRGPDRAFKPDQTFWGRCVQEGLRHPIPEDFVMRHRVNCCVAALQYELPSIADELVTQGLIDPTRPELGFAYAYDEVKAFAWLERHVDPKLCVTGELPVWAHLGRPAILGSGKASTFARLGGSERSRRHRSTVAL